MRKNKVLKFEKDEEGRAVINMTVRDDTDFLSPFSVSKDPVISSDVAEFLENSVYAIPTNEKLTLRIYGDCVDENEREIYGKAIKKYYSEKFEYNERELKNNKVIAWALGTIGVIALALIVVFETFLNSIWAEVVDIFAWVMLWESVDVSVFKMRENRLNKLRYKAFINMKIEFYEENNWEK